MQVLGLFGSEMASVTDVQARLHSTGTDLAYTTVMTVLSRLHEKGLLTRRKEGRKFLYGLAKGAAALTAGIVTRIHRALFKRARLEPLVALLDEDDLSTEDLRALRRLVDAKLKERDP
jgi:predicted transcriptional regulator